MIENLKNYNNIICNCVLKHQHNESIYLIILGIESHYFDGFINKFKEYIYTWKWSNVTNESMKYNKYTGHRTNKIVFVCVLIGEICYSYCWCSRKAWMCVGFLLIYCRVINLYFKIRDTDACHFSKYPVMPKISNKVIHATPCQFFCQKNTKSGWFEQAKMWFNVLIWQTNTISN